MPFGKYILDYKDNEPLPGVVIYESDDKGTLKPGGKNAITDNNGYFVIDTINFNQFVTFSLAGYNKLTAQIKDLPVTIKLQPTLLEEQAVKATRTYYLLGTVGVLFLLSLIPKK